MKQIFLLPALLATLPLTAKTQSTDTSRAALIQAINRDIWLPFVVGVNANRPALYNGGNSTAFHWVRSGPGKTRIMNARAYAEDARIVMEDRLKKGIQTRLEIRFLERHIDTGFAAEKCIIRYTATQPGKQPDVAYSIQQVFSRKEAAGWRKLVQQILPDTASSHMFDQAQPLSP